MLREGEEPVQEDETTALIPLCLTRALSSHPKLNKTKKTKKKNSKNSKKKCNVYVVLLSVGPELRAVPEPAGDSFDEL